MTRNRTEAPLLLVEDNPDGLTLTLRAFRRAGRVDPVSVAKFSASPTPWART